MDIFAGVALLWAVSAPAAVEVPAGAVETNLPDKHWPCGPLYQPKETWQAPVPSDEDRARGFVLFRRSYLETLHPRSKPRPDERGGQIRIAAARGEIEPFTVNVWAQRKLEGLQATIGPFTAADGSRLDAAAVSIRFVHSHVNVQKEAKTFQRLPIYLRSGDRTPPSEEAPVIAAGECARFWFTLRVPGNARPGRYDATVSLTCGNAQATLPVMLQVHPFRLREAAQLRAMYFVMHPNANSDYSLQEAIFKDMADHGMNSVILCSMCQLAATEIDETNTAVYDLDAPAEDRQPHSYRWVMENLARSRLCSSGLVFGNLVADRRHARNVNEMAARATKDPGYGRRDYRRGMQMVLAEHERRGWPVPTHYIADEPNIQSLPSLVKAAERGRELGVTTFLVMLAKDRTEMEGPYIDAIGAQADIWIVIAGQLTRRVVTRAREAEKQLWAYNGGSYGTVPMAARRFFGRYTLRQGLDGVTQWAIYASDRPGQSDATYLYHDGGTLITSTAWEAVREGIDDLRYDATARYWIAAARKAGLEKEADKADEMRRTFFSTMPEDYYWKWNDNFGYADYDEHRRRTAAATAGLVKLLEVQ